MKYLYKTKEFYKSNAGRRVNPNNWCTGTCAITHDKYYAWLKHRSQANYRKEHYELTWEDWQELWTPEKWEKRGRGSKDLCLRRKNLNLGWTRTNCVVLTVAESRKGITS